ncbi:hypothetical protein OCK74_20580 [Chitinophagaceae bacterium LB-8]|uniref:Uncharacterized protein n=1 Tax=Paraflavisolibacter caeni TaxID=2982496 RepID=A0A9X3BGU8_9BACT|nr:hypothetical protein [Paraflavisolibacter caeni]MCU7551529.1 hypothetical protein [Paraflavisolibacter caeni]
MKKIFIIIGLLTGFIVLTEDATAQKTAKESRREEKKKRANAITKQEEEGVLNYVKENAFGLQLRTNGYGLFYEIGRMRSPRFTNIYSLELTEIQDPKEEKVSSGTGFLLGNSYKFGKINNFYAAKLGFGQQYIFGQKGNKNGIAVIGSFQGGFSMGFLKPYYLQIVDNGANREIKYTPEDSELFLDYSSIQGSAGFTKGWSEVKLKPGAYAKTALRFDFGGYNESITAVELGMSVEGYADKIEMMALKSSHSLFFQAHFAMVFGGRK